MSDEKQQRLTAWWAAIFLCVLGLCLTFLARDESVVELAADLLGCRTREPVPVKLASQPTQPSINCSLPIGQSVFPGSCELLQNVCLDQGTVILYGPQYRPANGNGPPIDLPTLEPVGRQKTFYLQYWHRDNIHMKQGLPPLKVRPASATEARQYLAEPSFSSCTVPVVFYQHNSFNFAHTLRDNAARFYSALKETAWEQHAKVVLMTGGGLPISAMNLALWQPLSNMSVDSMADFSVRLPDEQIGRRPPGRAQPPTFEGVEKRCFQTMFVCLHDIATANWQLHAYGQQVVRYYGGQKLGRTVPEAGPPGQQKSAGVPPPESILRQLGKVPIVPASASTRGEGGRNGSEPSGEEEQILQIVFQKRAGEDRQLVNAADLVKACNTWRFSAPSGARVRALCWELELSSLEVGIAAAQQADIFVGAHGANIANAWLMRPGSSVVELTMFGFDDNPPHMHLAYRNSLDKDTQVQFWKLLLCDRNGSWTPGTREKHELAAGKSGDPSWPKYRNLIVRWQSLRTVLEAVVETGGDMLQYRQRWAVGRWWWLSGANQAAVYGGPQREMTCTKALREGLVD
ncbi:hypothetical protein D9Q98_006565 [Chlorella vulgaris]|uniref:Glycosyltransferase 61 catalytic domain-containing protein n=1 Tax=Chlorella vulgaris TaxID=3077 RepID=A0A9D4TKT5_CHLVU|nr:hypothetical protein D9Q98_006565 [Chlorella vulgaris]